jgi:acetoacetate decarboxylase
MKESEIRERAFAMPFTSPAFPPGPYRFIDREYMILTYRSDPEKLRAIVPEPLELAQPLDRRPWQSVRPSTRRFAPAQDEGVSLCNTKCTSS